MLSGRAKRDYARKALTPKTDGERVAALEAERLTTTTPREPSMRRAQQS